MHDSYESERDSELAAAQHEEQQRRIDEPQTLDEYGFADEMDTDFIEQCADTLGGAFEYDAFGEDEPVVIRNGRTEEVY